MGCRDSCCWQCLEKGSSSDISSSSREGHHAAIALTYSASAVHGLMGILSFILGILSSQEAEVWMAHRVSPIWSGSFYLLTAIIGVTAARKRTGYLVMCFGALCVVSMVVGVVCIQLLKRGLVTHLSDGATYKRDDLEMNVILALATSGLEILVCIATFPICCQMAAKVKEEVHMKRDGTFSIQVLGDKDIVIQQSDSPIYERLWEDDTVSDLARLSIRGECPGILMATSGLSSSSSHTSKNNHKSVSRTVSNDKSVSRTVSNDQSVPRTVSSDQSVSRTVSNDQSVSRTVSNDQSVSRTVSSDQSVSKMSCNNQVVSKTLSSDPSVPRIVSVDQALSQMASNNQLESKMASGTIGNNQSAVSGITGNNQSAVSGITGNNQSAVSEITGNNQSAVSEITGNNQSEVSRITSNGKSASKITNNNSVNTKRKYLQKKDKVVKKDESPAHEKLLGESLYDMAGVV